MKRSRLIVLICGTIICLCAKATDITTLSFSQPTSLPTGYVYSSSGSPTIATVENTSCVYLTNGGGTQVPSFNSDGSVSSSNGKRWMAFSPSVDCSVVVRIYSSKKVFTLYGKNGTVATFTQAAKQWDDWNITGLKGGEWYVIGAGNSQCYVSSMTFTASGPAGPVAVTGVTLNKTTTSIEAGQSEQLTATVLPANADNKSITWSSNNTAVATVDQNGNVSALAEGQATITVTTTDGSKTASCTVTVTAPPTPKDVEGISLSESSATVYVGATKSLTVNYTPADANQGLGITWTSSDENVATVADGVVTGVATGTATITATSTGGFTATCNVTVQTVAVTGVSLNKHALSLKIGQSETLLDDPHSSL